MSSNKKEVMKILLLALAVSWVVLMVDKMAQGEPFCDTPQQSCITLYTNIDKSLFSDHQFKHYFSV